MDPNWRHIIPPGQRQVISEGQCVEDCTAFAFPPEGIHIFAVMMSTHLIGKEVKLSQVPTLIVFIFFSFSFNKNSLNEQIFISLK